MAIFHISFWLIKMTLPIFVKVYLSSKIKIFCFLWNQFFLELSRVYQWVVVLNSFTLQRCSLALYMVYRLLVLFSICKIMMIVVKVILVGLYTKDLWYCVYVFYFYFMCFHFNTRCESASFLTWKKDWSRLVMRCLTSWSKLILCRYSSRLHKSCSIKENIYGCKWKY